MHPLLLTSCVGLVVVPRSPAAVAVPISAALSHAASARAFEHELQSPGAVFPVHDGPTVLLAKFVSPESTEKKALTEDEEQARDAARRTGLLVFLFGALPSVWAQDTLVWQKERLAALEEEGTSKKKKQRKR